MTPSNRNKAEKGDSNAGLIRGDFPDIPLAVRLLDYLDDLAMILLFTVGVVSLLGVLGWTQGGLIDLWVNLLRTWLGWGRYLIPPLLILAGVLFYLRTLGALPRIPWFRLILAEIAFFSGLGFLSIISGMDLPSAEAGTGGGLIGWSIATLVADILGVYFGGFILGLVFVFTLYLGVGENLTRLWTRVHSTIPQVEDLDLSENLPPVDRGDVVSVSQSSRSRRSRARAVPREFHKQFDVVDRGEEESIPLERGTELPALDFLAKGKTARVTAKEINQAAGIIEKTLADFGLPAKVVDFRTGPSVTQFAVEPGFVEQEMADGSVKRNKVRVSQISALANDLALSLSAAALRIEAPVPGKSFVGIEVPNRKQAMVRMRPILESKTFQEVDSPLAICLGRDVAGNPVAADLAMMPHLLIAGTTGSGKSVCIASVATCLVVNNRPEDLRLVMIDPKMVELIRFNGLPHLLGKVETDLDRISGVLRWCTMEMDNRYELLQQAKARDLQSYNRKALRRKGMDPLPRVVILVDELADLMMMAPDQTERTLVRLAQMARATGIHLVVATQRPSTDILTGLIKANFPARISFAVASGVDSRVILDGPGAETLLGKGDMLYLAPEAGAPIRLQGVFVDDREVEALIQVWQEQIAEEEFEAEPPWEDVLQRREVLKDKDDILEEAIELVLSTGEASASMLQRQLRVGYPRAARLMDELEELGVIGGKRGGGKTREVLIEGDEDPILDQDPMDEDD